MRRRAALAAALLLGMACPGAAQGPAIGTAGEGPAIGTAGEGPAIGITGQVEAPASYSPAALAAAPAVEVEGAREGGARSRYAGPLLWPLIVAAKPIDPATKGGKLQHALLARGSDGYGVVLAIGEIDPALEGKQVIIATVQDGAKLAAPRLVIPGDRHAARNVRDLVSIEVR